MGTAGSPAKGPGGWRAILAPARSHRMRSLISATVTALTIVGLYAAAAGASTAASPLTPTIAPAGSVVTLHHRTTALARPYPGAATTAVVPKRRPITGTPTTLPVLARTRDGRGATWLQVLLPGRPNGHTGWIRTRTTTTGITRWRLEVHLSTRRVEAYRDNRRVRSFSAIVGSAATPTPTGRFFVEETVRLDDDEAGAPYALALSARSNVLQEFDGGPGQTAIHGVSHLAGAPGSAVSHGCLRISTAAITWLAARIGPGTRVTIAR